MSTPPPAQQPTPPAEAALIALYVAVEAMLLGGATKLLTTLPVVAALPRLRRLVRQAVTRLANETPALIQAMIGEQAAEGRVAADRQLERLHVPGGNPGGSSGPPRPPGTSLAGAGGEFFDLSMDHGDRAAQAIRDDLTSELQDVRHRITRLPDDIYKAIAPGAAVWQVRDNNLTYVQAQAAAWQDFTRRGVTGFTDRSGRDWQLSSYVEMAVRTASSRAYNASSLARMQAVGHVYFTVPPHVHPCPLCGPWQGAILTAGPNPDPSVRTDGTIEEATAAGLFHPQCRDVLVAWAHETQPRPDRREWTGEDDLKYKATQKQRALEREIRKAKVAAAAALNSETAAAARADVRDLQARMRAHLAQHPYLGRQSRREQPRLRMDVQHLTPWKPPPGPRPPFSDGSAPDWTAAG